MTITVAMTAPSGIGGTIQGSKSGTVYRVSALGSINALLEDVIGFLAIGFIAQPVGVSAGTPATGVTAAEYGSAYEHTTILTIAAGAVLGAIAGGANLGVGCLLYTLPAGDLVVRESYMNVAITQTQGNITADTPTVGLGTTIASGAVAVLSGTAAFQNIQAGKVAADCNGTPTNQVVKATASPFELVILASGGLAHTVHFNAADGWAASGDAAALVTGTVVLNWAKLS
jgi:hypothetical protein